MTGVRLRVISPGYTGFSAQYVDALLRLRRICGEREIAFQWSGIQHLADIVSVRNEIARIFMESDFTHLLMVDGDIGYDPDDVLKMLDRGVDFAVAAPPARTLRLDLVVRAAAVGDKAAEHKAARFFVTPLAEDRAARSTTLDEHGFARIESIGGAFMLLKRAVFEQLGAAHPELRYTSAEGRPTVSYFEGGITGDVRLDEGRGQLVVDNVRLGEDRMFCLRWRRIGGDIHLLVHAQMTHTGPYTFSGSFFAGLEG